MSPFGAAALSGGGFGAAGGKGAKAPSGPANPFSGAGGAKLFTENPARLSPTMEPDDFVEKPWWQSIKLGQIVRARSLACLVCRASIGELWRGPGDRAASSGRLRAPAPMLPGLSGVVGDCLRWCAECVAPAHASDVG